MKKIILLLLLIPAVSFTQEKYRADYKALVQLDGKNGNMSASQYVNDIEYVLNQNNEYLNNVRGRQFSDPTETINKIKKYKEICASCYEKEYQSQLAAIAERTIDGRQFALLFGQKNIENIAREIDNMFPIKRNVLILSNNRGAMLRANLEFFIEGNTVGANRNLEIVGETTYSLKHINGRFLDVFPVWQKYFAPNAEQESYFDGSRNAITEKRIFLDNNTILARFYSRSEGNDWYIEFEKSKNPPHKP